MVENLDHWGFVIASYAITVIGTAVLVASSMLAMHRAEARKDRSRDQ
jgi:heme exporter protein D